MQTASACVNPRWVPLVSRRLRGTGVLTCAVAAFPFGVQEAQVAARESELAVEQGAQEIDVVISLAAVADGDFARARAELETVRAAVPAPVVLKVILETALWPEATIVSAAEAAADAGADFVKTSTGFHPSGGASLEAVAVLKRAAPGCGVKASGGIRTLDSALAMLDAGATRLGCSATAAILDALPADQPR
jgi:deoxyribose-phosphate aldolase